MKGYTVLVILFLLHYEALCIVRNKDTLAKPSLTEEHLNWAAFNGNSNTEIKNSGLKENNRPVQQPVASTIYNQQTNPHQIYNENNAAPSWDGENCPPKTTGLFPIQSDCRKFLNCFKGRGFVQSCAPGTLFNSENLECDFPAKVQCLDGNPSKIDSAFINRNPNQNFDLNTQNSNQDRVFNTDTNQYQPQSNNQYQPQSTHQYQPQSTNQYQPRPINQYQPQIKNPLAGSQFVAEGQKSNTNHLKNFGSTVTIDYGLQAGRPKPLYGSDFVVNGYTPSNTEVQPLLFNPAEQNVNFAPQNIPNGQVFNPILPSNSKQVNSNTNYPGSIQQQFPVQQNFNQNPLPEDYPDEYVNPGQETIPVSNEGSQFVFNQNNERPNKYGNVQETQGLREQEQNNQRKTKMRFPLVKEKSPVLQNTYNGNQKPAISNPSSIDPVSWMREQVKGKQGTNQNSYPNGYKNEESDYEEFQAPNNHFNTPALTFDVGNKQQKELIKQTHVHDNHDPLGDTSQSNIDYRQFSTSNGQNYNLNPAPGVDYSAPFEFEQPEKSPKLYPVPQNRQINGNPKTNKQFKIVVPNLPNPIENKEQSSLPSSYQPNTNPTKELNFNRGSSSQKTSNNDNGLQYPNQNENAGIDQNPNHTDNNQYSSQESSLYLSANAPLKCPNGFNGINPHPTDCSKFVSCANGRAFEMNCAPGTLFNPTLSICDFPYNVECKRIIYTTTMATTTDENYSSTIDVRQKFDHDTSSSEIVPKTDTLESESQPVLETLPSDNRQLKILRNPTSIDLPDNFLPNTSVIHTPTKKVLNNKLENNIPVKIDLKPNSTQAIRLRGSPKHFEGFLQVQGKPFQWGVVCDEPNSWTIDKADIVCKQLGFKRGAEQTWQGLTVATDNPSRLLRNIGVTKVSCNGQESVFHNCKLQNDKTCSVERDAVWVKCQANSGSECQPEEVSYDDKCYKLFVPVLDKQSKVIQDIGFSKAEALEHCVNRGGKLLDISSQNENDFISEWLSRQKTEGPILTSGVGLSLLGNPIWIWEGTENAFVYQNWWPGWEFKKAVSPSIKTNRALCIVLQKSFPCPSNPNSTKLCDSEYYHWEAIDCGTKTDRLPYICERNVDDIGCVNGAGSDYIGSANTTASGNACLSWEEQAVLTAMKYRVSEKTQRSLLNKHNKCRNPDGTDLKPWCYVQTSIGMVRSEFCDIPVCNTATKLSRASSLIEEPKCGREFFECQPNECINQAWVCDNQADCSNGMDEKNCSNVLKNFIKTPETRLRNSEAEKWLHTTVHTCANRCIQAVGFVCQSFSHNEIDQTCILNERKQNDNSTILESDKDWNYYETDDALCIGKFICENGNCIDKSKECDGHNDCGDRSDETKCTGSMMGYELRLAGGNSTNEGRVEVKVLGEWGVICDDKFDQREANVICRELGFLGSIAVKPNSYFGIPNQTRFVLDDLDCNGSENSLYSCQFKEWGVHDCNAQETAGVICKVAGGRACSSEEFECKSGECIPQHLLCDSYADCTDESDELPERCNVSVTTIKATTPIITTTSTTTKAPKKFIQKIAPKKKG